MYQLSMWWLGDGLWHFYTTFPEGDLIMLIMVCHNTVRSLAEFVLTGWWKCPMELLVFHAAFRQGFGIHQPTSEWAHQPATQTVEPRELASVHLTLSENGLNHWTWWLGGYHCFNQTHYFWHIPPVSWKATYSLGNSHRPWKSPFVTWN